MTVYRAVYPTSEMSARRVIYINCPPSYYVRMVYKLCIAGIHASARTLGVLATKRDSVSTYSRVITNPKGSVCPAAIRGEVGPSTTAERTDPGRENKAMHEAGEAGQE